MLDSWFLTDQPLSYREEDHLRLEVIGQCGVLYRDEDGKIANTTARWELQTQMPGIQDCKVRVMGLSGGVDASAKRLALLKKLGFPEHMSANAMLQALNLLYDLDELQGLLKRLEMK